MSADRIEVNGHRLAYRDDGAGSPVVLIHGSLDDMRTWSYQIAPFARRHRVITYSRRHHWPNDAGDDSAVYRAADHADDLAAIIRTLGLGSAHLVGASYGAVVALLAAATQPALVRSLVLGEPPAFNLLDRAELEANDRATMAPARRAIDEGAPERGIESFLNAVVGPNAFARFPARARAAALENAREFELEARASAEELFGPLSANDLPAIQTPALVMRGERSPAIFGSVTDVLGERLPNARRVVVPDASHAMHRHNAPFYNEAVLEFLGSIDGSESSAASA